MPCRLTNRADKGRKGKSRKWRGSAQEDALDIGLDIEAIEAIAIRNSNPVRDI